MQDWKVVWRETAPLISTPGLLALKEALERDDPKLLQKVTTSPPPLAYVQDWPIEGACPLTYTGWKGDGLETVGECEEYFAYLCAGIDIRMGEPAGCRWLLNQIDDWSREDLIKNLLPEVKLSIERRLSDGA
jgi:hypothetical protein